MQGRPHRISLAFEGMQRALARMELCQKRDDVEGAGIAAAEAVMWCFSASDVITDEDQDQERSPLPGLRYVRDRVAHQATNPVTLLSYVSGPFGSPSRFGSGEPMGAARQPGWQWLPLRQLPRPSSKRFRRRKRGKKGATRSKSYTEEVEGRPVSDVLREAHEVLSSMWRDT